MPALRRTSPASAPASDGREHGLAARGREHGVGDLLAPRILRQVAGRTGLERRPHELGVVVGREDHDARREGLAHDRACDGDPVEHRQSQVDHGDVRWIAPDRIQGRPAIGRLARELHLGARADRAHEPLAEHRMVVCDEDAYASHGGPMVDHARRPHPIG